MQPIAEMMTKFQRPTLRDLAKTVGVSASTASRALNNNSAISEEIRKRVFKAAKEANYIPNSLARGLALKRSQLIGLVVPSIANPFFAEILRGANDIAQQKGYVVALCDTQRSREREELFSERLLQSQVDGIIVTGSVMLEERIREWRQRSIPLVLAGRRSAGLGFSGVSVDDISAGYQATQYLLSKGHKKILFLGGAADSAATKDRQRGYLDAMETRGLTPLTSYGNYTMEFGFKEAAEIAKSANRPDAVFAANDLIAIGLIMGLAGFGVSVPNDLAVIGCDDIPMGALIRPALTSVQIPMYEIGVRAMGLLLQTLENGESARAESILLDCQLVIRASA
jgi:LacI family transcriptional regulator, galactose operon repressor